MKLRGCTSTTVLFAVRFVCCLEALNFVRECREAYSLQKRPVILKYSDVNCKNDSYRMLLLEIYEPTEKASAAI